jgi:menaquinol-cytochrome c reductase iron-sulfur subunit
VTDDQGKPEDDEADPAGEGEGEGEGEGGHGHDHGEDDEPATPELIARRRVLARVCYAIGGCSAAAICGPIAGFVVGPMFRDTKSSWRPVGRVVEFAVGQTVSVKFVDSSPLKWAGVTANTAAWLRRVNATEFIAFSVNCAHLGCPVRWLPSAELFMCPCHGGVYYADGSVAAGPPPHPLSRYPVRITGENVEILAEAIPIG